MSLLRAECVDDSMQHDEEIPAVCNAQDGEEHHLVVVAQDNEGEQQHNHHCNSTQQDSSSIGACEVIHLSSVRLPRIIMRMPNT